MPIEFSVVIPTFRRRRELTEAINSVLGQSGVTLEVLVVDDCPDGSAQEVVEGFRDDRVMYLCNRTPTGGVPSIVRNLAWPRANGSFVHFLDDDDIVPPGHYAAIRNAFESDPNVGLIFGRIEPFGIGPAVQLEHEQRFFQNAARAAAMCGRFGTRFAFTARMLFGPPVLVCSAGVVRRACLARVGGFDPDIRMMEDADFYARIMRACGAYFLPQPTLRYRIGTPSLMHAPAPSQAQIQEQRAGRHRMQAKYRKDRGTIEFLLLALFARTMLPFLCRLSRNWDSSAKVR